MSLERMTSIQLPGGGPGTGGGLGEWGRKTRAEMIAIYRKWAEHQKAEAERVLAAADADFICETYLGVNVMRNRERVD